MNCRGVSVLIGFILVILISMVALSVIQTQYIPYVLKDFERKHLNEITEELYRLSKAILNSETSSIEFSFGVQYPKYPFLLTPPTFATTVFCNSSNLNISYHELFPYNGYVYTLNTKTKRIEIYLNYFINQDCELIYENTAIFKRIRGSEKLIILSGQKVFQRGYVNLYIINSTFDSISTNQPMDLIVIPVSHGGEVYVRDLSIEFKSVYPEYWKEVLSELGYEVEIVGDRVSVHANNITLRICYVLISSGYHTLPLPLSYSEQPYRIVKLSYLGLNSIKINVGQSLILKVKVLDRYNNPISGESVEISVSDESVGYVYPNEGYTDMNGEIAAIFNSISKGNAVVEFRCPNCTKIDKAKYYINVN